MFTTIAILSTYIIYKENKKSEQCDTAANKFCIVEAQFYNMFIFLAACLFYTFFIVAFLSLLSRRLRVYKVSSLITLLASLVLIIALQIFSAIVFILLSLLNKKPDEQIESKESNTNSERS